MGHAADFLAQEQAHATADAERLHRQVARLGAQWLSTPLSGFWTRLASEWATRSVATTNYSTHQADMEAVRALVAQERAWAARLCSDLEEAALAWRSQQPLATRTLSLMSEIELSANLHAQQLAGDLEKNLADALEASDRRVAALAAGLGMRPGAGNPWAPDTVLRVFAQSLPLDDFSATMVPAAFDELRKRLPALMREVLPRLSALLEGSGVVAAPGVAGQLDEASESHAQPDALRGDTVANLRARPALDPAPAGAVGQVARRDEGLPRYRDIVHDHLAQWRQRAQAAGTWRAHKPAGQGVHVLRSAEVMTMASVLQGEDPAPYARALARDGETPLQCVIREEMLKAAAQLGFDQQQTQFSEDDEDAIDLVAILFDTLAESNDLMPRGTRMLGKLVLPYVKVAMMDDSLFNRRSHPARRLLDALAESCDGNAGESAPHREMLERAESVVDQIVARFQEDQAIFELAAKELRDYLEQQRLRAEIAERRMAEALHGRERLHFARQDAHAALVSLARDQPLSGACHHFLEDIWQTALLHVWLRYGADTARYRAMRNLGVALVDLDAAGARLDGDTLARGFIAQLVPLRECLALCGQADEAAEDAIARLGAGLANPDAERAPHALAPPLTDGAQDDLPMAALRLVSHRESPQDPVLVARLRKLRAGQGLRIREEHGHESAARIAWVSPLTGRFLIVNRRGLRKLVVTAEELAILVGRGEVVVRAIEAPVDHAMRQVWEQLRAAS